MRQWTADQKSAIDARGENLLLSAAAGSGKTAVLVERVAELLKEGADVRGMLIVTFTRAAAADMRMSLIRRLTALAQQDPRYRQQAEFAEFASISTIHSFCTELLRAFFQEAGVDPAFRIADSAEANLMREKALDAAMNAAYEADSPDHRALTCGRSPDEVRELAVRMHAFLMERPDPWGWLEERIASLEQGTDEYTPVLAEAARRTLSDALSVAEYALELCAGQEKLAPYMKNAEADLELIETLSALTDNELRAALIRPEFTKKASVRGMKEDPDAALYDQLRKQIKELVGKAGEPLSLDTDAALADLPGCAAELKGLAEIVRGLEEEYTRLKDEKGLLTFADLERRSLQALQNEEIVRAVRERYQYVFVDEYQDVSDVQEAILSLAARENGYFCVGDVKQSIYRFRHAEPTLFMRRSEAYAQGEGGRLIVLNRNFRSRPSILEYANCVFERAMHGGASEIVYDDAARLYPGAHFEGDDPPIELHLIDKSADGGPQEDAPESEAAQLISEMKDAEAEALLIARRIRELRGTSFWDGKENRFRPLQWRDFVILTRQARDVAQQMLSVLRREGVPAYADVSGGYMDVMEVQVALSLLRLIENRRRDVEWIAVLRSPCMGLTSRALARIRARFPEGEYADAVRSYAQLDNPGDELLADRLKGLIARLDRWQALSRAMPLSQLVFTALSESGFYAAAGALPGGAQRQANLDMLCDRAAAYESSQTGGLTGFLMHIEGMNSIQEDMGEAHVLGENDDVVRIMTIHKSKGLEFPVVFGAMMGRKLGGGGRRSEMIVHREAGIGLRHMDASLGVSRETLQRKAAEVLCGCEADAEELRILYVMLTRPRDRLILTGSVKSAEQAMARWRMCEKRPVSPGCYLDLLVPPMLRMPGGAELGGYESGETGLPAVDIRITNRARLARSEEEASGESVALMDEAVSEPADGALLAAYRWQYPYEGDVLLPMKLTASGISRELSGPAQPPELMPRPAFLTEGGALTGAERGTATHAALQGLEVEALRGLEGDALHSEIVMQLNRLRDEGVLTEAMRDAVRPMTLVRFFESGLGRRMLQADEIKREWMFTLKMSAQEATGIPTDETLLVQGSADCCFIENGAWILLDYKTDRAQDEQALTDRYAPQLELYARALREITGIPVREVWLCLVGADKAIRMDRREE